MSNFKGTKGKWKYEVKYGKNRPRITVQIPISENFNKELIFGTISEDDCTVSSCCCTEEHANAKLVACAPEMLEMLERLSHFEPLGDNEEINALIKKATEI